jgi:hypothetical protein
MQPRSNYDFFVAMHGRHARPRPSKRAGIILVPWPT